MTLAEKAKLLVHVVTVFAGAEFSAFLSACEALAVLLLTFSFLAVASLILLFDIFCNGLPTRFGVCLVQTLFATTSW